MGTSVGELSPIALDLPFIHQVGLPDPLQGPHSGVLRDQ